MPDPAISERTKNDNSEQEAAAQSAQTLFEVLERREVLAQKLKTGSCSTEPGLLNPASVAREVRLKASQLLVFGCLALPFWAFAATKDYHQELRVLGRGHASLEQVDRRYRELSTKLQGGQYTRDEWNEHFELGRDLVAIKSNWEPTFWASLSFLGTGVVSGFLGLGAHDSSERLKLGRNSGDSLKLLMEIWQRISTASGARAKQKREEAGRALNDLDKSIRESVTQLFALLDDDFATVVWAYGQDKTAEGYTSNRFVLIPSFVAGSVGLSSSSLDEERLSTLVNEWPEGLPRLEMEVGYRSDTDIVFGEIILVHPKSSGANREVLLRVKVDGTSEVEKANLKYRPYTAALQSAPLRSALKQDELRNVVVSDLSNTFQGLLIQMALARETGRGQASELRQRLGERSLPPGTGVPIRLGQQGQLEIGEAPEPLPAWRQGTQEAK